VKAEVKKEEAGDEEGIKHKGTKAQRKREEATRKKK
jgi:hypothetical protein